MSSNFAELDPTVEPLGVLSGFVNEFIDAVHPHPLFTDFSREETEQLAQHMQCYGVSSHSVVIREGDEGDFMAILVTGRALVVKSFNGIEKVLHTLKPGELVGEMALIDGQARFASCITTVPSDFAVMHKDDLLKLLSDQPALGNKFLLMLLGVATKRLRQTTIKVPPEHWDCCY